MRDYLSNDNNAGVISRLRILAYFVATITLTATLATYAFLVRDQQFGRLQQLREELGELKEWRDEATTVLEQELRLWKDLLFWGTEQGRYHELLSDYFLAERMSRQTLNEVANSLVDDPKLGKLARNLVEAHLNLGRQRREALQIYNTTALDAHTLAATVTRDLEDALTSLLNDLSRRARVLQQSKVERVEMEIRQRQDAMVLAAIFLAGLALLGFVVLVDRQVGRPAQQATEMAALIKQAEKVANFGAWEWDLRTSEQNWSGGVYRMLGIDPRQPASRQRLLDLVHEDDRGKVEERMRAIMQRCGAFDLEYRVVSDSGATRVIQERGSAIAGADGRPRRLTGILYDITQRKRAENKLTELANFDPLTGLPNRSLLYDRLNHALLQAERNRTHLAILFLDLDGFKGVNDAMGHAAGDKLLQQAANRLRTSLRKADTVARLGGDEFTVILEQVDDKELVSNTVVKLLDSLREPFEIKGREIFISASIGIAYFPDDAADMEDLLKHADAAMYRAKQEGRDGYYFFTEELNQLAQERLVMESSLRLASGRKDFFVHYQPQIALATGELVCVETLLRWRHNGQLVSPLRFVPMLEETGLILTVGSWVLDRACRDLRTWREQTNADLRIAVNLSLRQIGQANLLEMISQTLTRHGLDGTALELEITESLLADESVDMSVFNRLRGMGLRLAIDDFGTGYSSLGRLKSLPVDKLKIDRSFVKDIGIDRNDDALTSAIIALAHRFDLTVTAEGVESQQQLDFLRDEGCDQAQGYLFAPPMEFSALLNRYARGCRLASVST